MPNKNTWIWSLLAVSFLAFPLSAQAGEPNWKQLCNMYKKGAVLVDVRTPREVQTTGVKGAIHIQLQKIRANANIVKTILKTKKLDKKPIILFCYSGYRASVAMKILRNAKYKHVYNGGGFKVWRSLPSRKKVVCPK